MVTTRRAVIDVGTNSIKLLVADVSGRHVEPVREESRQTRLGKGFYETRRLQPESIQRTAEAVAEFERLARELNSVSTRVIATSAARDWVKDLFQAEVWPLLEPALLREKKAGAVRLVGTGGTTSILARIDLKLERFDRDRIEGARLSLAQVKAQRKHLWSLPLAERKEIPGLPKLRADVILTGVIIYEAVMEEFGFAQLRVSTRGLRFAAVMD